MCSHQTTQSRLRSNQTESSEIITIIKNRLPAYDAISACVAYACNVSYNLLGNLGHLWYQDQAINALWGVGGRC